MWPPYPGAGQGYWARRAGFYDSKPKFNDFVTTLRPVKVATNDATTVEYDNTTTTAAVTDVNKSEVPVYHPTSKTITKSSSKPFKFVFYKP